MHPRARVRACLCNLEKIDRKRMGCSLMQYLHSVLLVMFCDKNRALAVPYLSYLLYNKEIAAVLGMLFPPCSLSCVMYMNSKCLRVCCTLFRGPCRFLCIQVSVL